MFDFCFFDVSYFLKILFKKKLIILCNILGILEYINNILTNGFVPSLYSDQEKNSEIVQRFKDLHKDTSNEITT